MTGNAYLWPNGILIALVVLIVQILASLHVFRTKESASSASAWLGLIWLAPVFGLISYFLFGISRIQRRARLSRMKRGLAPKAGVMSEPEGPNLVDCMPDASKGLQAHARLAGKVSGTPLTEGNSIMPLEGGREAYDAMVEAIEGAQKTVALTSYIFQSDQAGRRFIPALLRAHERGVHVRVMVDAVGNLYDLKPVSHLMRRKGIPFALFNPARFSWRLAFFNLRTHRKILLIDGQTGFTGGMNIRRQHLERDDGSQDVRDTHFKLEGPIVRSMTEAFSDDWVFATGEELPESLWMPDVAPVAGAITARAVADGPDEPVRRLMSIFESALASARGRVCIVTPYFLPEASLMSVLKMAALRGVEIDIIIPANSNIMLFNLVVMAHVRALLRAGCSIYLSPLPFDHSKMMVVDDCWVLFGSSNWDARSLKLNFEFNIEAYDRAFAIEMAQRAAEKKQEATKLTLQDIDNTPLYQKAIGRLFWLASPYL